MIAGEEVNQFCGSAGDMSLMKYMRTNKMYTFYIYKIGFSVKFSHKEEAEGPRVEINSDEQLIGR